MSERRTQAERRAETQAAVLASAGKLFGDKGYAQTSLEEIAGDCGISIAPIYHYFGNKKSLFQAVNEAMEARILAPENPEFVKDEPDLGRWRWFLELCKDARFRQIVLVDGPTILGLERLSESRVSKAMLERIEARFAVKGALSSADGREGYKSALMGRMIVGALAEAGLFIGDAANPEQACQDADELVAGLIQMLNSFSD